jgi:hypothetical protein
MSDLFPEFIESALLASKRCSRWLSGLFFQSSMNPFVTAVLLWAAMLNAFVPDPHPEPLRT